MNRIISCLLLFGWFIPGAGAIRANDTSPSLKRYEFTAKKMGVEFRIVLYAANEKVAKTASDAAFDRVSQLERVMSDYDPKSEIMKLCHANDETAGKAFPISTDLIRVIQAAQKSTKLSGGAFDITLGPVVRLWRLARRTQQLPPKQELQKALALVGMEKVRLNVMDKTLSLAVAGMRLDFGGIGKGFAADEALKVLNQHGLTRALIAASGDITTGDAPPDRDGWIVDVAPIGPKEPARTIRLKNASVSTSGDLFQHVEIGGVRYSHIVNPKTGLGLTGRRSVTVIAPTGTQADSLTKAFSLLPLKEASRLAQAVPKLAYFMVVKESDSSDSRVSQSANFKDFVVNK